MPKTTRISKNARRKAQQSSATSTVAAPNPKSVQTPPQAITPQQAKSSNLGLWQIINILLNVRLFGVLWGMIIAPLSKKGPSLALHLQGEIADIEVSINAGTINLKHQSRLLALIKAYLQHSAGQRTNMPSLDVLLRTSVNLLMSLPEQVSAEQWKERLQWAACFQILFAGHETQPDYAAHLASFYHLVGTTTTTGIVKKWMVIQANGMLANYIKALKAGEISECLKTSKHGAFLDRNTAYAVLRNALNFNGVSLASTNNAYVQLLEEQQALLNTVLASLQDKEAVFLLSMIRQKCVNRQKCNADTQLLASLISIEVQYAELLKKTLERMQLPAKAQIELDPQKVNLVGWLTYEYVEEDLQRLQVLIQGYADTRSTQTAKGGDKALNALALDQSLLPLLVQARGLDPAKMQTLRALLDTNLQDAQALSKGSRSLRLQTQTI